MQLSVAVASILILKRCSIIIGMQPWMKAPNNTLHRGCELPKVNNNLRENKYIVRPLPSFYEEQFCNKKDSHRKKES